MELILQDKRFISIISSNEPSTPMKHSSTLQQSGRLTHQQYLSDKPSDESQRGGITASGISDYKRNSIYDCYADRLGSPKRMR
jgi:hypothetical protein